MASVTISPNMNLTIPVTGQEVGPDWANDLNNSLTVIDAHDHTTGSGVQITPQGLNINADFPLNGNNLTLVKSVRFTSQLTPLAGVNDIGCLYESGVDLYYNDGSGNQIRLTQSGGIVGTPGSIAGLVAPASATYVALSQTFVWQSAALTAANMDAASYIFRNQTPSSFGLTLSPPAALAANYGITLPLLPGVKSIVSLSPTGLMAADIVADNSSIEIAGGTVIQIKDLGVTTAKLADSSVTTPKIADLNVTTAKIADLNVTNGKLASDSVTNVKVLNDTITRAKLTAPPNAAATVSFVRAAQGATTTYVSFDMTSLNSGPVIISIGPNSPTSSFTYFLEGASSGGQFMQITIDGNPIYGFENGTLGDGTQPTTNITKSTISMTVNVAAGLHTYAIRFTGSGLTATLLNAKIFAVEI